MKVGWLGPSSIPLLICMTSHQWEETEVGRERERLEVRKSPHKRQRVGSEKEGKKGLDNRSREGKSRLIFTTWPTPKYCARAVQSKIAWWFSVIPRFKCHDEPRVTDKTGTQARDLIRLPPLIYAKCSCWLSDVFSPVVSLFYLSLSRRPNKEHFLTVLGRAQYQS